MESKERHNDIDDDRASLEEQLDWLRLMAASLERDWDNEHEAIYDKWRALYGIERGERSPN